MRIRAYILSVLLHAAVLLLTVTGLSLWPSERPEPEEIFTVEFGTVAELERAAEVQAPLPEKDVPLPKAKPAQTLAAAPSAPTVDRLTASPETRQAEAAPAPQVPQPTAEAQPVPEPPRPSAAEAARAAAARAAATAPPTETADATPPGGAPAEEAAPKAAEVPEAAVASAGRAAPAPAEPKEQLAALQPLPDPTEQAEAEAPPKPQPRPAETAARTETAPAPKPPQPQKPEPATPVAAPKPSETAAAEPAPPRPRPRPRQLQVATAPTPERPEPAQTEDKAKPSEFDPQRLAALLDKRLDTSKADVQRERENAAPVQSDTTVTQRRDAPLSSQPLSASELAAIRGQFERCWNPPAGARDAHNLVVVVRVSLREDGTLMREPELVNSGEAGDRFWRAAAESALRAVRKCEPVQGLDPEKYERWRDIELTFNPRDMLG